MSAKACQKELDEICALRCLARLKQTQRERKYSVEKMEELKKDLREILKKRGGAA